MNATLWRFWMFPLESPKYSLYERGLSEAFYFLNGEAPFRSKKLPLS
jgi:hypothetical protein